MVEQIRTTLGDRELIIETGKMAKQSHGAVTVQYGDTVVLSTVVASQEPREAIDFFPLTVEYREKTYAAGKIPGGFFKREGRPGEKEVLTSRLIDRPLRPLFPEGYQKEVQVISTVLSADKLNDPDVLALVGASAAIAISEIPFMKIIGAVRVGRIEKEYVVNPTYAQLEKSDLDLVVAATNEGVVMVEGGAKEVPEEVIIEALDFGFHMSQEIISIIDKLVSLCGCFKEEFTPFRMGENIWEEVEKRAKPRLLEIFSLLDKKSRKEASQKLEEDLIAQLCQDGTDNASQFQEVKKALLQLESSLLRERMLKEGIRPDGRRPKDIREITCEVGMLPRAHGSALFTRGETQALVTTTLGTSSDEQFLDELHRESSKAFMLHYNFPPFCVGEVKPIRSPGRREIGHGALAERALFPVMPSEEAFPYTVRVVSDILESNGSSSMATVCGGSLSLMDAGVPMKRAVAGIAMGLVREGNEVAILSDIMGLEDHLGDMDFKVAGTDAGITSFQMDIKTSGVTREIMADALMQAKEGRLLVLSKMAEAIAEPRPNLSPYAPRIIMFMVDKDKIREIIGPGGKVIRNIIEVSGAEIEIEDDGKVLIASIDEASGLKAQQMVREITEDVQVGKIYKGKVKRIMSYGAFVEVLPKKEGLLHISEIADRHIKSVEDVLKEGDEITVKCIDIDKQNRFSLSKKAADKELGVGV